MKVSNRFTGVHFLTQFRKTLLWMIWIIAAPLLALGGTFQDLGTHPDAVNQDHPQGKTLSTLEPWNGRLYVGFGFGLVENDGPIPITPWDPSLKKFVNVGTAKTEDVSIYRPMFGKLWAPAIDGHVRGSDFTVGSATDTEVWENPRLIGSTHAYDMASLDGKDLWIVGGYYYNSGLFRSLDGGKTWKQEIHPTLWLGGNFLGVYQNKLYLQGGSAIPYSCVFNGTTWSKGPTLLPTSSGYYGAGWHPIEFAGKMVYQDYGPADRGFGGITDPATLLIFDGTKYTTSWKIWDFKADGKTLYALGADSTIRTTTDLVSWNVLATAPATARSIAVLNGRLYVGGTDSKLYEYSDTVNFKPNVIVQAVKPHAYEGLDSAAFKIIRFGNLSSPLTVSYSITGTATQGSDFTAIGSSITIPSGQSSVTIPVTVTNDSALETNEALTLNLAASSSYDVAEPSQATVTIFDDDRPTVQITASDAMASEPGTDKGEFTLTRHGSTASPLSVSLSIGGTATKGVDYQTIANPIVIPAGSSSVKIPVLPIDDSLSENPSSVMIKLVANTSYNFGLSSEATVTIEEDGDLPVVSVSWVANASEAGPTNGSVKITRVGNTSVPLTVNFSIGGNASVGSDYTTTIWPNGTSSSVSFPVGQGNGSITVKPINDSLAEGNESVVVTLSSASSYVIGSSATATTQIADNDGPSLTNVAPSVTAGPDQIVTLPAAANLNGSVTDDGLPNPPAATTKTWSKVSGPGTVTFSNASSVMTSANFSVAGVYVLRLTTDDGALSKSDDVTITVQSSTPPPVVIMGALAGGSSHTLTLRNDGTIHGWGLNTHGELGLGTTNKTWSSIQNLSLGSVIELSAGRYHSVALKADGTVWTFGNNGYGQLGDGTVVSKLSPIQVSGVSGIDAVTAGIQHTVALKSDGTVWAWGYGLNGQIGNSTTNKIQKTPVLASGLSGVNAIAAGGYHSVALKSDGTVWTWGLNTYGQLGLGYTNGFRNMPTKITTLTGVTKIAAGNIHTICLKSDGTVWTCGRNLSAQLGDGTTTQRATPVLVGGLSGIVDIAVGAEGSHNLALKSDGTVWAWGAANYGQIGDGTIASKRLVPVQVLNLTQVSSIAAGLGHSLAMKADGTVWSWGLNNVGQLGLGNTNNTSTATQVSGVDLIQ
jgi:alpha-tubulin suppressor-like RCC1 family protein